MSGSNDGRAVVLVERILEEVAGRPGAGDARLLSVGVGPFWTVVRTSIGTGMAATMADAGHGGGQPPIRDAGSLEERPPLELAALLRSASSPEAAVGLAAVNALLGAPAGRVTEHNAAALLRERGRGHLVALVGRFPFTDALRTTCRELWVFERGTRRRPDDLGEEHMAELLPHAELVAVTATSLLNGTLDRIVSLVSRDAFLMLLGPSTPLAQCVLSAGFDVLCGTVVEQPEAVVRAVSQGAVTAQIHGVRRVCLWRDL